MIAFNRIAGEGPNALYTLPALIEPVELVATLEETERGADGFGSTGL